jgi:ferredoxin
MSKTKTPFVISIDDHEDIHYNQQKSVLICLEENDIGVHYHCREGFCGACRTKLIAGQVEYTSDPLAYIDDDEFLPCCSIPTSNITIKVEY